MKIRGAVKFYCFEENNYPFIFGNFKQNIFKKDFFLPKDIVDIFYGAPWEVCTMVYKEKNFEWEDEIYAVKKLVQVLRNFWMLREGGGGVIDSTEFTLFEVH